MSELIPPPTHTRVRFLVRERRTLKVVVRANLSFEQTVWFGANDAALPGYEQHVAPEQYRRNLISIITHPVVKAQCPRIILITPPPVDEYALADSGMGGARTAEHTKLYADTAVEVGKELGVAVLNIWACLMEKSGWQPGSPLNGSLAVSRNWAFSQFFTDGVSCSIQRDNCVVADGNNQDSISPR